MGCFQYDDGRFLPWIAESPADKPWGLGCVLCRAARAQGGDLAKQVPASAFTEFAYGNGLPGLLVQPLTRHGNNALRQRIKDLGTRIQQNTGHEAAVAAAAAGHFDCMLWDMQKCRVPYTGIPTKLH